MANASTGSDFPSVAAAERFLRGEGYARALVMGYQLLRQQTVPAGGTR
ncbi:hypothetical protein ACIA5C_48125 [Actinoplanes sp. NPDC051343]